MANFTQDGTINLLCLKGKEYSTIGQDVFDNWNSGVFSTMQEIDLSVVCNWLFNAKKLKVDFLHVDEHGTSLPGYPLNKTASRYKISPDSEDPLNPTYVLDDEYPGVSLYHNGDAQLNTGLYPSLTGQTWLIDGYPDDESPRYLPYLLSDYVWFECHLDKWYRKKVPIVGGSSEVGAYYYTEHTLTENNLKVVYKHNDYDGNLESTRTYDLTITETYY